LRIKAQFLLGIIFIIIAAISSTSYVLVKDTEQMMMQGIDEKGRLIINYLSGVSVDPLLKKDEAQLSYYLKKASDTPGIAYLIIVDKDNKIVASNNVEDIGTGWPQKIINLSSNGRQLSLKNFSQSIDVKNGEGKTKLGTIYAGFDTQFIESELMNIYLKSGVIAAGMIVFSIFLTVFLTGRITKPLAQLIEGTEIIASGNLRYKIKVNVRNEFQVLANSFNGMTEKLNDYYDGVLMAFTMALDSKDKYSPGHSKRVGQLSMELARKMNMSPRQVENIRLASILKDIGNLSVDTNIFEKKEALSADEIIKIQKHPEISAKILKNIQQLNDVIPIILQHHERYDGLGYPNGLKGAAILREAKILAIADAYDAMVTPREHRPAIPVEEAVDELRANKGKQFDPDITEAFVEILIRKGGA
jgi:HD-GYP domain-containing protein (c-di-GMP phosphodiesterase class II)